MPQQHIAWPEIGGAHIVRKTLEVYPHLVNGPVTYLPKIKLHGTNASVQLWENGAVIPQSRTSILTPESDNNGFAKWVLSLFWPMPTKEPLTIFGEWCGPGIQKGTAIQQIPRKIFAVFAAVIGDAAAHEAGTAEIITDPETLAAMVDDIPDCYVLPWAGDPVTIDWLLPAEELTPILDRISEHVLEVEACDPWVKSVFGVEGVGEGLVYYPATNSRKTFSDLCFKAKGEKHKVVKTKKPAQVDPEVAAGAKEFADLVLPEGRLEQGLAAIGGASLTNTGKFIEWISNDVQKETSIELEASGLTWKQVQTEVKAKARDWFKAQCMKL